MSVLSDEITDDPLARGYAGMTDQELVDSLNALDRQRNRTSMTGREVRAEVDDTEYDALLDAEKGQFLALTATDDIDPFGFAANVVKDIFPGSTTLANLQAARVETISRAVEIGLGVVSLKMLKLQSIR